MKGRDIVDLLLLGALWGASFMFMRIAVPQFGPVPTAGLRVAGGALMLLPIIVMRGEWPALRQRAGPIAVVGAVGVALPFVLYAVAAQSISSGVMSILNATTPIWGALIAWAWLSDRPTPSRFLGMVLAFVGVAWLAWDTASIKQNGGSPVLAVAACLAAALCYGFIANYTKKRLAGVPPMVVAAGGPLTAALLLAVPSAMSWPVVAPSATAWWSVLALAVLCTGFAYLLYFRLIANVGAAHATTVTFLIPLFAVFWGTTLLDEPITPTMVVSCVLVLLGTGLSTGVLRRSTAVEPRRDGV